MPFRFKKNCWISSLLQSSWHLQYSIFLCNSKYYQYELLYRIFGVFCSFMNLTLRLFHQRQLRVHISRKLLYQRWFPHKSLMSTCECNHYYRSKALHFRFLWWYAPHLRLKKFGSIHWWVSILSIQDHYSKFLSSHLSQGKWSYLSMILVVEFPQDHQKIRFREPWHSSGHAPSYI